MRRGSVRGHGWNCASRERKFFVEFYACDADVRPCIEDEPEWAFVIDEYFDDWAPAEVLHGERHTRGGDFDSLRSGNIEGPWHLCGYRDTPRHYRHGGDSDGHFN